MTHALASRVSRLERRIVPMGLAEKPVMLVEPDTNAGRKAFELHRKQLADAMVNHDVVILVSPTAGAGGGGISKVRRVPDVLSAMLMMLSLQRAGLGGRTSLDDLIDRLGGNVVRPDPMARIYGRAEMSDEDDDDHCDGDTDV